MPNGNRRRRPYKRSIHCVHVQHRHTTRTPHGNKHPTPSTKVRTQPRRGQKIKEQLTQNSTATHPLIPNQISFIQRNQTPLPNPRQRTPNWNNQQQRFANPTNPCRRCEVRFSPDHLQVNAAQKVQCNLCKNVGHYSKVCRSAKFLWQSQQRAPQQNFPQARRVKNTREATNNEPTPNRNKDSHTDANDETVDHENTFFIHEIFDNWSTVNFVKPNTFKFKKAAEYSTKLSY